MKKAFTLIELLVVIAIIAILAAMLMPALTRARRMAQISACSSQVHNLGLGWAMFRKDHDNAWTRRICDGWDYYPESMADIAGLGYVQDMGTFKCPALDTPYPRDAQLVIGYVSGSNNTRTAYLGQIYQHSYFADEGRIPKEPVEQRAIMADGIEMVTRYGKEPANHSDAKGRTVGSNVLFVDQVVQWTPCYQPGASWTLPTMGTGGAGTYASNLAASTVGSPGGVYGWCDGESWFVHTTGGTWRRGGFIQNLRLLTANPSQAEGGGAGKGEDDIYNTPGNALPSSQDYDFDDIYYIDPVTVFDDGVASGLSADQARMQFQDDSLVYRCYNERCRTKKDCSLAGGYRSWWKGGYNTDPVPPQYAGHTWGWPDETW